MNDTQIVLLTNLGFNATLTGPTQSNETQQP